MIVGICVCASVCLCSLLRGYRVLEAGGGHEGHGEAPPAVGPVPTAQLFRLAQLGFGGAPSAPPPRAMAVPGGHASQAPPRPLDHGADGMSQRWALPSPMTPRGRGAVSSVPRTPSFGSGQVSQAARGPRPVGIGAAQQWGHRAAFGHPNPMTPRSVGGQPASPLPGSFPMFTPPQVQNGAPRPMLHHIGNPSQSQSVGVVGRPWLPPPIPCPHSSSAMGGSLPTGASADPKRPRHA